MTLEVVYGGNLPTELVPVKHVEYNEKAETAVLTFEKNVVLDGLQLIPDSHDNFYIGSKDTVRLGERNIYRNSAILTGIVIANNGKDAAFFLHL